MDEAEKRIGAVKNPRFYKSLREINPLINSLVECMLKGGEADDCIQECLRECRGERCEEACLGALGVATGTMTAYLIAGRAIRAVELKGSGLMESIASAFKEELERAKAEECPDKAVTARILFMATVELFMGVQEVAGGHPNLRKPAENLLLLAAPALAEAYQCVGDEVFEYLEAVRPFIGEEAAKRIVAALEEGSVLVGGVDFKFKPVKTSQ
ncbi:MAG: hypothetical protein ACO2PM_09525 [Pyrobaculum sp.]|jgi:hypothetical protein